MSILSDDQPTSQPANKPSGQNVNLAKIQILEEGSGQYFDRWPVSQQDIQPAAIGQPTSHLTIYQPDPIFWSGWGVHLLYQYTIEHFVRWPTSQPASCNWTSQASHLTKCQPDSKSDLEGCPSFTKSQPGPKSHLGGSSSANQPCHFTQLYIGQAFPDKKYVKISILTVHQIWKSPSA